MATQPRLVHYATAIMKYWPLQTKDSSSTVAYLFLDERGLGTLHVERPRALAAMRRLKRGELPEGAALIPNHQLLRIRSCRESRSVTARLHRNKSRRFRLQSTAARDELMVTLENHPAVKEALVETTPIIRHAAPQLGGAIILTALGYMSYQTAMTTSSGQELVSELALTTGSLPYLGAALLLLIALFAVWRRPRASREVDEVLFV